MVIRHRKALVLPGAGARGAYQVGVLKAIAELLPKPSQNPFSIITGTSAGAINAAVLASRAGHFELAVTEMERVWANFEASQVFRTDNWMMFKSSLHWLAALVFGGLGVGNPKSLLDNTPLRELLTRRVPRGAITRSIERGYVDAVAVTASAYTSDRSVTFYQSKPRVTPWERFRRIGRPAKLTVDHLLASAAVPFVFPPVRVGGEYYGDGSMRHPAPLSAAIHLGADRLLVIGVRDEQPEPEPSEDVEPEVPSLGHLAGYMLDTLFMDGLFADLERLTRINLILSELGTDHLQSPVHDLRPLDTLIVVPKEDLRDVARHYVHELPRAVRVLLQGVGASSRGGMQLTSYLLFESGFTRELIAMGYRDARAMESDLRAFMLDEPIERLDAPQYLKERLEH
jgi:NTE family protein